jgi:hypothetical protein
VPIAVRGQRMQQDIHVKVVAGVVSMENSTERMDSYLRGICEKTSELAVIGTKRCQTGHYSQRSSRTISVPRRQSRATKGYRLRRIVGTVD